MLENDGWLCKKLEKEPAYLPRNVACIPWPNGVLPPGERWPACPIGVSHCGQIRAMAWPTGRDQRRIEGWRLTRPPPRSASRPAQGTAIPLNVAVYRGPRSASGSAGFEERCRLKDRTTACAPLPASLEAMLNWPFTLSQATRTPQSTTLSKFSSVMGTSNGRFWGGIAAGCRRLRQEDGLVAVRILG
jgi:hypothetical protein